MHSWKRGSGLQNAKCLAVDTSFNRLLRFICARLALTRLGLFEQWLPGSDRLPVLQLATLGSSFCTIKLMALFWLDPR